MMGWREKKAKSKQLSDTFEGKLLKQIEEVGQELSTTSMFGDTKLLL